VLLQTYCDFIVVVDNRIVGENVGETVLFSKEAVRYGTFRIVKFKIHLVKLTAPYQRNVLKHIFQAYRTYVPYLLLNTQAFRTIL